jgi:predicted double-glycine peptidase
MNSAASFAAALSLAIILAASTCAAAREPVRSLLEIRRDKVVVQDFDVSCGAAALATLLTYQHDDPVPEREIVRGLMARKEYLDDPKLVRRNQGFSLLDLKRYAVGRGYQGLAFGSLRLADLVERAPVMTPVSLNGYNHFVIFRGLQGNDVLLADPAWGNRTMPVEEFKAAWIEYPKFGKVGFVVARGDGSLPPNRLAPHSGEILTAPGAVMRGILSATP